MNTPHRRVDGKVAIITGAAQGQGARQAQRFVAEGAKVVVTDINREGERIAAELGAAAFWVQHDVTQEAAWRRVIDATLAKFGHIDVLVNNAGVYRPGSLADTTTEDFDLHYRVNVRSTFLGMKSVIEPMQAAGGGSIVNISSVAGMRGFPGMFSYAATKWATRGMTKCAARELAPYGIRVNSIHPGLIDTPMLDVIPREDLKTLIDGVPLRRIGTSEDVVEIAMYLASGLSSYVTGSEFVVDGGFGL
ncbi:MAG: glucose 1-dehydrogenase [Gammaproteobacteria bacterium]|nr:MAG: glucose 1-dehydrogenase [Gammaproteobacteria bacterium]